MEREKELTKLTNVLRRTARMALQAEWTGSDDGAARFTADRYNRVLARLRELDPELDKLFDPLPDGASLSVIAIACRQLAAYYEDEAEGFSGWMGSCASIDPRAFKKFWSRSTVDIEDLGEHIRESVENWARQRRRGAKGRDPEH